MHKHNPYLLKEHLSLQLSLFISFWEKEKKIIILHPYNEVIKRWNHEHTNEVTRF